MKSIKFIIAGIILFLVIIFYKTTIVDCPGCGGCSYTNFEGIVKIDSLGINPKNGSIKYVYLKSDTSKALFYFSGNSQHFRLNNLDQNHFKDSLGKFHIKGAYQTSGTCVPYFIDTIY